MDKKGILGVVLSFALLPLATLRAEDLPGRFFRLERILPESGGRQIVDVTSILQDREGFIWIGTSAGLARYDGYQFVFYAPEAPPDEASGSFVVYPILEDRAGDIWAGTHSQGLFRFDKTRKSLTRFSFARQGAGEGADAIVLALEEDPGGDLWVGTRLNGLARFDSGTGAFTRFPLDPAVETVWDLLVDGRGSLWVATQDEGLFKVRLETGDFVNYRFNMDNPRSLGSNTVWTLFEDREGTVWAGTNGGGLNAYDPEEDRFSRFTGDAARPLDLAGHMITALGEDEAGRFWIGTSRSGLRVWDRKTGDYSAYGHDPRDPDSIGDDGISSILRDTSGIMWVGTVRGGLGKCLADLAKFPHFKPNPGNPQSLSRSDVRALMLDTTGTLWVGFDEGFDRIESRSAEVTRFDGRVLDSGPRKAGAVQALLEDRGGRVWIGTEGGGLMRFDTRTGSFARTLHDLDRPEGLSNNRVYAIAEDRGDPFVLWIGTHNGLDRFDTAHNRWRRFGHDPADPASLSANSVRAILEDRNGALWVGTSSGLNRLDKASGRSIRYVYDIKNSGTGLINNVVCCLHEDASGTLWIGTEAGLSRFVPERNAWLTFTTKDGLPGSVVCGILEDGTGSLWISTNRGLTKFEPGAGRFTNFGLRDGLQALVFNPGACFQAADGRMFFGGVNGFNCVAQAALRANPCLPPVVLTGLTSQGRNVKLDRPYVSGNELKIPYKFGFISLDVAALCYEDPPANRFAYKLEPRDGDWIDLGFRHVIPLSGLDSGAYVLRVKAANPDGVWNDDGLTMPIEVIPPFWRTPWFVGILAVFLMSGILIVLGMWRRLKAASASAGEQVAGVVAACGLTAREEEVLRLVLEGARNRDIEKKLFISASTVRNHIYNIYRKLGVKSRLELIHRIGKKPS
jgi:ligand-binding sensor domain-containing protein/DNA-binding CsgD family transcriptional regulator